MIQADPFAAQILENGARGFAGYAASLLFERHPEVIGDGSTVLDWRCHLAQRVLELAAAVRTGEPDIFAARARWIRVATQARDQSENPVRASFECLHDVLADRLPRDAFDAAAPHLSAALKDFAHPPSPPPTEVDVSTPTGKLSLRFLEKSLEGDGRGAIQLLLDAVEGGLAIHSAYLDVLMVAQREVGRLWHHGELGISEEHLVTACTKRAMSVLCHHGSAVDAVGKTVVSASVAGNVHEIGTRLVADFFELAGWRSVCLGADVPSSEIRVAASYFDADLLVLSATLASQLKAVAETIELVQPARIPILVGGQAFEDAPNTWKRVGADAFAASADWAIEIGAQLA
ncbi:MAG: cobalamin-dependent protein [Thermoanaerobaculia bacterium]|nr:cobalamin-dependent protein [Thermoanaerobaculia bacterium]